jgi:glycosyltransferase involved in cell wall biosynthesis
MTGPLSINVLTKDDPTYGRHSSYYRCAFDYGEGEGVHVAKIAPGDSLVGRIVGKLFSTLLGSPQRDQNGSFAECKFYLRQRLAERFAGNVTGHIAAAEDHIPLLRFTRGPRKSWIGTVHYPPGYWRREDQLALGCLGTIVTLCERDRQHFAALLPQSRVVFIPHGVDIDFFRPAPEPVHGGQRLLFVGKWLRDFDLAGKVLKASLEKWPQAEVDIVVARRWAQGTALDTLDGGPRVRWHENVEDGALLRLYQNSTLLVLPLLETSANNALVEALACGLVPVVNEVGGVSDYGGGGVFPACRGDGVQPWLDLIGQYFDSEDRRQRVSEACRRFAERELDWRIIRRQHVELYRRLPA